MRRCDRGREDVSDRAEKAVEETTVELVCNWTPTSKTLRSSATQESPHCVALKKTPKGPQPLLSFVLCCYSNAATKESQLLPTVVADNSS